MKLTVEVRQLPKTEVKQPLLWKSRTSGAIVSLIAMIRDMESAQVHCIREGNACEKPRRTAIASMALKQGINDAVVWSDFFPCDHEGNELPQALVVDLETQIWRHKGDGSLAVLRKPELTPNDEDAMVIRPDGRIGFLMRIRDLENWEPAGPCEIIFRQTEE